MWYNINWNKYAAELIPTRLRQSKLIAYVKVLISPLVNLHDEFLKQQSEDYHKLNHNGQICYLRKALNDRFDNSQRRIYIGNGNQFTRKYLYTRAEARPIFLGKTYLHSRNDYEDTSVDFIVFVPASILATLTEQIKAEINYFKEGVKTYKLVAI